MPVVKVKPTSAGRRAVVKVVSPHLHKGAPFAALLESQHRTAGRNNNGHITTRHRGGGHKQHYRLIDFRRNDKDGIPAKVERLEYDPNRTAHLALLCYADGERRYILAPRGVAVGTTLISGAAAPIKAGNTLPIRNIPVGSTIHAVESCQARGRSWRARPVPRSSCSPVRACTPSFVCAQARSAACMSIVGPPWVKSVTKSTTCAKSVKPVRCVGVVFVRPSVASR